MADVNNDDLAAALADYKQEVFRKGWPQATPEERLVLLMSHMFDQLPAQIAAANAQVFAAANLQTTVKSAAMAGVTEALEARPQREKTLRDYAVEKGPWAALGGVLTGLGWLGQYLAEHWGRH